MAKEGASEQPANAAATAGAPPRPGRLRSRKVKVAGLLFVVMLVEAAGLYLLIPPPAGSATGAEAIADPPAAVVTDLSNLVEVPLDPPLNITNSRAAPGSIIHVSFKLVAVVARSHEAAFAEAANTVHHARIRQAIVQIARSSSMDELSDPELSTLKRLIREEINKVLRKSYVVEVVISDFKTMEQ